MSTKAKSKNRHENGRSRERRAADFAVQTNTAKREPLDADQAAALFRAIEANNLTGFGIRKLSRLELDGLHPAPERLKWEPRVTLLAFAAWLRRDRFVKNLLRAGADPTIRWRGGAQASVAAPQAQDGANRPQQSVVEMLRGMPSAYATWIVCSLARMRLAGRLHEQQQPSSSCSRCNEPITCLPIVWPCGHVSCEECFWAHVADLWSRESDLSCPKCQAAVAHDPTAEATSGPSAGSKCRGKRRSTRIVADDQQLRDQGHPEDWACSACRYRNFSYRHTCRSCGTDKGETFLVHKPSLPPRRTAGMASVVLSPAGAMAALGLTAAGLSWCCRVGQPGLRSRVCAAAITTAAAVAASACAIGGISWALPSWLSRGRETCGERLKAESLRLWKKLPDTDDDIDHANGQAAQETDGFFQTRMPQQRTEKFQACSLSVAASTFLGHTRSQRTHELHAAAGEGRIQRLQALLRAGVDVEATNEYGQTALMLAAQNGNEKAVALLLGFAASVDSAAHGGVRAVTAAAAGNHLQVVAALCQGGADLGLCGSHGLTPLAYAETSGARPDMIHQLRVLAPQSTERIAVEAPSMLAAGPPQVKVLIGPESGHPGAGSYVVDGAFTEDFLQRVETLWSRLPVADKSESGSDCIIDRSYFCDSEGWLSAAIAAALGGTGCSTVHRCMRFLHYFQEGGFLPPHLDLSKTDETGGRSTHTLLLYLRGPSSGGQTVLLDKLCNGSDGNDSSEHKGAIAVEPRRGRILLFPHCCPHRATPVVNVPKLLIRGEAR